MLASQNQPTHKVVGPPPGLSMFRRGPLLNCRCVDGPFEAAFQFRSCASPKPPTTLSNETARDGGITSSTKSKGFRIHSKTCQTTTPGTKTPARRLGRKVRPFKSSNHHFSLSLPNQLLQAGRLCHTILQLLADKSHSLIEHILIFLRNSPLSRQHDTRATNNFSLVCKHDHI